jgi:hypothetical protein
VRNSVIEFGCIKKGLRDGIQVKTDNIVIPFKALKGVTIRVKTCSTVKIESRRKYGVKL